MSVQVSPAAGPAGPSASAATTGPGAAPASHAPPGNDPPGTAPTSTAPTSTAPTSTDPPGTAPTSTAPTGRSLWRAARGPVAVVLALVLAAGVLGALRAAGDGGRLDPQSYAPAGSRALATLLEGRGVAVRVVPNLPALRAELEPDSTVLVPVPEALTRDELAELGALAAPVVVVGAQEESVEALDLPVTAAGDEPVELRSPACPLPAATRAGPATAGGVAYEPDRGTATVGCYAAGGRASLLALTDEDVVLLGASDPLTNEQLGEHGNAALALGLLGGAGAGGGEVLWLVPRADRDLGAGRPTLRDVLPDAVPAGVAQLAVAAVLLALWRGRRLGRVVVEPLPVVVRAAEAVEGRSRLYRAAGARDVAAAALRTGARDRLVQRLGLPPDADRGPLVQTLTARVGGDPARVDELLYGAAPVDDTALVQLADDLDRLRP